MFQRSNRSASHRSGKHSISSGSTNRRFDSDVPSSDSTSPPTPRDGDLLVSPTNTQSMPRSMSGTVNYYDYSEQYESQEVLEPPTGAVPTGFVRHIKTIIEERGTPEPVTRGNSTCIAETVNHRVDEMVPNIPELPASPVPRRITRNLVLAGLGPESSSGEVEISGATPEIRRSEQAMGDTQDEKTVMCAGAERLAVQPTHTSEAKNRHSILSQAGSSVMESSTLEFAVRCSIPMVADNGMTLDIDDGTSSVYAPDAGPISEDGITDLLEGYQRTDTKGEGEEGAQAQIEGDEPVEKRSNHAAKSSDEQSFKSCTDAINVVDPPVEVSDNKSSKSGGNVPESDQNLKDSDAKSFRTCKDAVTPDRNASLPTPTLKPTHLFAPEQSIRRSFSEAPSSSPLIPDRKPLPFSTSESSMPKIAGRFRANSKLSSTQGSAAGSSSSFQEYGAHTPPSVPPRDSSSSKEAQQSRGVANFLLRSVRQRFARASPGSNLRPNKENCTPKAEELEILNVDAGIPTPPPMKDRTLTGRIGLPSDTSIQALKLPQRVLTKERTSLRRQSETVATRGANIAPKEETPKTAFSAANASDVRQTLINTPSPLALDASSMYSPENISLTGARGHITPVVFPQTPEQNRRDSQTTTHLSWTGGNAFQSLSLDRQFDARSGQEDSTTDLRLPAHRHIINHLPDLKEESHEDSSLNTSASNFYPVGGSQPAVFLTSTDDVAVSRKHRSVRSSRNSVLQQMHLPSMNFSSFGSFDEALDHRVSRSLDLAPAAREELARAVMPRSASAGEDREKYKSVFAGLDTPAKTSVARQYAGVELYMRKSPELLVKEVDSLTIPSVNGLTTRLSELLPKLKEALGLSQADDFPDEEGIMEKAMEKLNDVGVPAQKRSSARLRPVPGSPNMLVVDDEVFEEITGTRKENAATAQDLNRGLAALRRKAAAQGGSQTQGEATALPERGVVVPAATRDKAEAGGLAAEIEAPSPAHFRRNNTSSFSPYTFSSHSSRPSIQSLRSRASTPTATATDTRPWNLDKNYPWATDPSVDISLPPPSASKHSPRPGPSHLRNRLSNASSESAGKSTPYGTSSSPHGRRGPTGHCYSYNVDGRRSLEPAAIGFDASGYPIGPVRVRDDDQSHGAGERYPTSALPLPSNLHIYPGQASNFSLETSDDEPETTSARKKLFKRRPRRGTRTSVNRRALNPGRIRELQHSRATNRSPQQQPDDLPDRSRRHTFANAHGMSTTSYRATKCRIFFKKALDKIFPCIARPVSPVGSDSTGLPAPPNTRVSVSSESSESSGETQSPDRASSEPESRPVIRNGPGNRFTSGFLLSFPPFSATSHHVGEPTSAFLSNNPPRSYDSVEPEPSGPSNSTN